MTVIPATPADIGRWLHDFLDAGGNTTYFTQVVTGFGGDRLDAIQDGGGFFAKEGDEIVGVVSYSPTGEYNRPNIIGLWARNNDVQVAVEIVRHAIDALADCLHAGERIVVDVLYSVEKSVYTEAVLGRNYYDKLDLHDHPWIM